MQQNFSSLLLDVSTRFGHPHAHHQELNNCSSSLWFYRRSVVVAVLLFVVGPARPHISISYMHSAMGGGAMLENQSRSVQ